MSTKMEIVLQNTDIKNQTQLLTVLNEVNVTRMTFGELEEFIKLASELPEKLAESNLHHMLKMLQVYCLLGDYDAVEHWSSLLVKQRSRYGEGTEMRTQVERYICCANVIKPSDNAQVLLTYAILFNDYKNGKPSPCLFCSTLCRPSILSGRIDLSEWGRNFRAVASILSPMLPALLYGDSDNAIHVASAELLYERNKINEASIEIATATSSEDVDIAFAALIIHARIVMLDNTSGRYTKILEHAEQMIKEKEAYWLYDNMGAAAVRFDICNGNIEAVTQWQDQCQLNELSKVTPINAYIMDSLARAYIATDHLREAITILEKLIDMNTKQNRTYDKIDCYINSAIACELMGDEKLALSRIEQALEISSQYGYIRIFADKGRPLLQLIAQYKRERDGKLSNGMSRYIEMIAEAAKSFALIYPRIYIQDNHISEMPELTQSEVQILNMLDEGKTNKEMADAINIKPATVKFHIGNLLEKFEVSNRTSLVSAFHKCQKKDSNS